MSNDETQQSNPWETESEYNSDTDENTPIPRRGVQLPQLKFDGGSGVYIDVEGKEKFRDGVIVTPLRYLGSTRILWDSVPVAKGGSKLPLCGSDDNVRPYDVNEAVAIGVGPNCIVCPRGQWEGRVAPSCKEIQNYAVLLSDDAEATILCLSVQGNSIKPLAKVWSELPRKGAIYSRQIRLTAEQKDIDGYRYFVIVAELLDSLADFKLAPLYKQQFDIAGGFVIHDRNAIAREARKEQVTPKGLLTMRNQAANTPTGEDLPFETIPQIGEPGAWLFDADGNRRSYGADGRIEPTISHGQREFIETLGSKLDLDNSKLDELAVEMFGNEGVGAMNDLSYSEASKLIEKLKETVAAVKDDAKAQRAAR